MAVATQHFMPVAAALCLSLGSLARAVEHPAFTAEQIQFFEGEVRPILQANCFECHGGLGKDGKPKVRSEFQIISRRGIVQGGAHGSAYDAAKPEDSLLLKMVRYVDDDHQMPPKGKLEPGQIELLSQWVAQGMPWTPADQDKLVEGHEAKRDITTINERTRSYWSYRPLTKPAVPRATDEAWNKHPIDAFLFDKLRSEGLTPNPPAAPRALIRRAYANLIGLPPSPEAVETFAAKASEEAWGELIKQLLDSPHYGEKWARHWLDVVRYADSNGFERDGEKPHIWRYRDYVIEAFNRDKPYDQFIREQLAGDELGQVTSESLIATGYHRLMQWDDEPPDPVQYRYDVLDDNVKTTSEAFLGMTLGCARCHDHKGDPISQRDYYRFMAFFAGVTHMDLTRTIQSVGSAVGPEELARQHRLRQERVAKLEQDLAAFEEQARTRLVAKFPDLGPQLAGDTARRVLLPDAREQPQDWLYSTSKPAEEWAKVSFRPTDWKTGQAPFGQVHVGCRTAWDGPDIWLQKTFGLTALPAKLSLAIFHDEAVEVYLNGQIIYQDSGKTTKYKQVPLGPEALRALQTGRNVLAAHCRGQEDARFFDLGLMAGDDGNELEQLIRERGRDLFSQAETRRHGNLRRNLERARKEPLEGEIKAMTVQENGPKPGELFVHLRGSVHAPGDQVTPGFPAILASQEPRIQANAKTSGRRRALADWIAARDNPRTARVMVNRLWQHHFGRGFCPTANDFGFLGQAATHPELLDWLASEFIESGWSIKHMQRLFMTSRAYRLAATGQEAALLKDPQNNFFWRFDMRRLSAEEIRDGILAITGKLNLKVGGPSFFPKLPPEVLETASTKEGKWGQSPPEEQNRRSIYIKIKRSLQPPELVDFDFADSDSSCAARFSTTVPTQALAMLNSGSTNEHAAHFADRLEREKSTTEARIQRGLELVTSRPAKADEIARGVKLLADLQEKHRLTDREALERFCLMALNLNEFLYLD